jgi:hypothetical protein
VPHQPNHSHLRFFCPALLGHGVCPHSSSLDVNLVCVHGSVGYQDACVLNALGLRSKQRERMECVVCVCVCMRACSEESGYQDACILDALGLHSRQRERMECVWGV